ncbi:MAG: NUDIX domain-containing protein [Dehalococcoidia bacterium]
MSEEHPRTMFALAGGVYAFRGGKLLMLERRGTFMGGFWHIPGGMQDPGETPRETAERELFEETGLRPSGPLELVTATHIHGYDMDILSVRYAARCDEGEVRISDEHAAWGWIDPLEYRAQHLSDEAIAGWETRSATDGFSARANRDALDELLAWLERHGI